eukprot:CAMPEP_0174870754 /NCGR_PEP_ID=MMETSP1114-20130205/70272_1 /TAXON_ID=312471 /ORGANISM="Neobodo designis, Strain CCAP 1951/1" /LENGTH=92 /DNA_ID=CAMNT_0016106025 /DNA_START=1 /DNA_END=275 /DNA_ORIENTATION=-
MDATTVTPTLHSESRELSPEDRDPRFTLQSPGQTVVSPSALQQSVEPNADDVSVADETAAEVLSDGEASPEDTAADVAPRGESTTEEEPSAT